MLLRPGSLCVATEDILKDISSLSGIIKIEAFVFVLDR